jgi:hypothetical protein
LTLSDAIEGAYIRMKGNIKEFGMVSRLMGYVLDDGQRL